MAPVIVRSPMVTPTHSAAPFFPFAATLFAFALFQSTVSGSLVDTKAPIVIFDGGDGGGRSGGVTYAADDTHFGYSLAFLKGSLGDTGPRSSAVSFGAGSDLRRGTTVFIGAPKERRHSKNSGVVWQCRFNDTQAELACSVLASISNQKTANDNSHCKNSLDNWYFPEEENDQWIGASLTVSGKSLYACASRWKSNGWWDYQQCHTETALVGGCYSATNQQIAQLHTPLRHIDKFYYLTDASYVSEYWYLYAEAGFSSHTVAWTQDVLLGAPGNRKWRGAVIENPRVDRDSEFIYNKAEQISEVESHGLFGYSVTSGLHRSMKYYIAGGAPRAANLKGVVIIMRKRSEKPLGYFKGEQMGSYFGYAVATADLNGDGYDELLVGAPLFTADFQAASSHNTGCVFIYDVRMIGTIYGSQRPLEPSLCPNFKNNPVSVSMGARFGSAITNLGDINNDKMQDFAVSAPYDDDGVGTVFIYLGGRPLSDKPSQIIRGKSLKIDGLHGWGTYMLGGGTMDVDENGTPDLAVAAFESRHAVILRTRPSVYMNSIQITFHEAGSTGSSKQIVKLNPGQVDQGSFRVRICIYFRLSVTPAANNDIIDVWLQYDVDPIDKRVTFSNPSDHSEHQSPLSTLKETCLDKQLDITRAKSLKPITFQTKFWYNYTTEVDSTRVQHASLMLTPPKSNKPNSGDSQYKKAYREFNPYLPAPFQGSSTTGYLQIAKDNCDSDGKNECDPKLSIKQDLYYQLKDNTNMEPWVLSQGKGKSLTVGKLDVFTIKLTVRNTKETAYLPTIRITWMITPSFTTSPSVIRFQATTLEKSDQCSTSLENLMFKNSKEARENQVAWIVRCSQPLQNNMDRKFELSFRNLQELKITGDKSDGELAVTIEVFPEGMEPSHKAMEKFVVPLKSNVEISVTSRESSTGQQEIEPKKISFIEFTQVYIIENKGASPTAMDKVVAAVWVPNYVGKDGKPALRVADPSSANVRCEMAHPQYINFSQPSDFQKMGSENRSIDNTRTNSRSRRSTPKGVAPQKISVTESSDNFIIFSGCKSSAAVKGQTEDKCQKLLCYTQLPAMGSQEIEIFMYLLPTGYKERIEEDTKGIRVDSLIQVSFLSKKPTELKGSTQRKFLMAGGVPAWIYLASGAGGTILFLLITFALFKCGFFRRKTKEQLKVLKRQTMQHMDANALMMLDASIDEAEHDSTRL